MTRNELKTLIKSIILQESRVRRTPPPTGAALRIALDKVKAKQAALDAQAANTPAVPVDVEPTDPVEKHIFLSKKFRSKFANIKHRIDVLNAKSAEIKNEMEKRPGENDMDYMVRVSRLASDKLRLDMDQAEELLNLHKLNNELGVYIKSPKE